MSDDQKPRHTPGPWTISDERWLNDGRPLFWIHGGGSSIAEVRAGEDDEESILANANLITAVPDLLAFAEAYRESLTEMRECDLTPEQMALLTMADAAISKARRQA